MVLCNQYKNQKLEKKTCILILKAVTVEVIQKGATVMKKVEAAPPTKKSAIKKLLVLPAALDKSHVLFVGYVGER